MQTAGKETKPILEMDGPKLLRKPFRMRYLLFNLPDSHGLSAYYPLENSFRWSWKREQHSFLLLSLLFFQVIRWVNQRKRLLRYT